MNSLQQLSDDDQRRVLLQAAKETAADQYDRARKSHWTLEDLDREMRDAAIVAVLLCWTVFVPLIALADIVPLYRLRRRAKENWREWLDNPDPECAYDVVDGAIRKTIRSLSWRQRRQVRPVSRELDQIRRHWRDFDEKLRGVREQLGGELDVDGELAELQSRREAEADPLLRESLARQIKALEGQAEARQSLVTWKRRLASAQAECEQTLRHLRSRLALMAASAGDPVAVVGDATQGLRAVNTQLASTQSAAEEVLHIGRARL